MIILRVHVQLTKSNNIVNGIESPLLVFWQFYFKKKLAQTMTVQQQKQKQKQKQRAKQQVIPKKEKPTEPQNNKSQSESI